MFDVKWIRDNPEAFDRGLARRGLAGCATQVINLEAEWREAETAAQEIQSHRNRLSKEIGMAKAKGLDATDLLDQVANDKDLLLTRDQQAKVRREALDELLASLPNLPAEDVPDGTDEHGNRLVRSHGFPATLGFPAKEHFELGEALGMMDFARAGKLSGARFVVLKGQLARLERAIGQFMIDLQTNEFGYTEISPPLMVRDDAAFGTGSLPKFGDDLFRTTTGLWLIPTAEVPLTNLVADEILDESDLPLRFTAWTPCFRSEAGAAGKDTRGMIRQHQFEKVEIVSITRPEDSAAEHERMTACAEEVLKRLGLAYRVVLLSSGDMGFAAQKTYDLEVWLPGQGTYREISSCSNCGAFQAQRMKARYRPAKGRGTAPVHTLNGSGLAIGRTLIAILENFQGHNGTVALPPALQPYMGGQEVIAPD